LREIHIERTDLDDDTLQTRIDSRFPEFYQKFRENLLARAEELVHQTGRGRLYVTPTNVYHQVTPWNNMRFTPCQDNPDNDQHGNKG
jgi:hypothetical protein